MRAALSGALCALLGAALGLGLALAKGEGEGARPARLLGSCSGRVLAGLEESDFPAKCEWIEPIRYDESDGSTVWRDDTMP